MVPRPFPAHQILVVKVLLEHSHPHGDRFLTTVAELSDRHRNHTATKPEDVLSGLLQEKFAKPRLGVQERIPTSKHKISGVHKRM